MIRAGSLINNLSGGRLQGGSTLDQQFIKLTYFSTSVEDQNLKRKIQEGWLLNWNVVIPNKRF